MTTHIELIGPSGAGKSTIYEHLKLRWRYDSRWTTPYAIGHTKPNWKPLKIFIAHMVSRIHSNSASVERGKAGVRFSRQYPEFTRLAWQCLNQLPTRSDEPDYRIRLAYHLFNCFSAVQLILEHPGKLPVLMDEGLLQKRFVLMLKECAPSKIEQLLHAMPEPAAIIALNSNDPELITHRWLTRKTHRMGASPDQSTISDAHRKSELYIKNTAIIVEKAKTIGIPVLSVEAEASPAENTQRINDFMGTL